MESSIHSESHIQLEEELEMQCKICYLKTTPLLRLCNCKGSIGFVHEECILKWVTRKLEKQTVLEMPSCELCKTPYSA
jgi:E3 ubiquitin-protein ligase MARCH6